MTTTTRLDWKPASPHLWHATGVRGRYKIVRVDPNAWTLYGTEPGGLSMLSLPATGIACDTLHAAQLRAERVDREPPAGEMSGC